MISLPDLALSILGMAHTAADSKSYKNGKAHCKFPCTSTDDYQIGRDECTDGFCSKGTDEPPMPVPHQGRENIAFSSTILF